MSANSFVTHQPARSISDPVIGRKSGLNVSSQPKTSRAAKLKIKDPNTQAFECSVEVHHCDSRRGGLIGVTLRDEKLEETCDVPIKSEVVAGDVQFDSRIVVSGGSKAAYSTRRFPRNIALTSFDNVFSPYIKPPD